MLARLSVMGLYLADSTIFEQMTIPVQMEHNTLVDLILSECSELSTVYPDPAVFSHMIASWSRRRLPIWERLYKTTTLQYDPIENYDRREEWSDQGSGSTSSKNSGSSTDTSSETAFNSDSLKTTGKVSGSTSETSSEDAKHASKHSGWVHGNIGVTTSQQMIQQERDVVGFDIYQAILEDFIDAFCVRVYY